MSCPQCDGWGSSKRTVVFLMSGERRTAPPGSRCVRIFMEHNLNMMPSTTIMMTIIITITIVVISKNNSTNNNNSNGNNNNNNNNNVLDK